MNFYSGTDIGAAAGYVLRIPPSLAHSRSLKFPHIKFSGGFYWSFALSIQSKPRPMHETPCLSILHLPVCSSGLLAWEPSESPRKCFSECLKRNKDMSRGYSRSRNDEPGYCYLDGCDKKPQGIRRRPGNLLACFLNQRGYLILR